MWRDNQECKKCLFPFFCLSFFYTNFSTNEDMIPYSMRSSLKLESKIDGSNFSRRKWWTRLVKFLSYAKSSVNNLFVRNKVYVPRFIFISSLSLPYIYSEQRCSLSQRKQSQLPQWTDMLSQHILWQSGIRLMIAKISLIMLKPKEKLMHLHLKCSYSCLFIDLVYIFLYLKCPRFFFFLTFGFYI